MESSTACWCTCFIPSHCGHCHQFLQCHHIQALPDLEGFTFDWYIKLFDNTALLESFANTIFLAVVSTLLSTVVGTLAAVGMYK